jgi:hypothetical protein
VRRDEDLIDLPLAKYVFVWISLNEVIDRPPVMTSIHEIITYNEKSRVVYFHKRQALLCTDFEKISRNIY